MCPGNRVRYKINACFAHGREYFRNAGRSEMSVKPLLLYYGVLSCCRGVILANDPGKKEESLKPRHGLETVDWQHTLMSSEGLQMGRTSVLGRRTRPGPPLNTGRATATPRAGETRPHRPGRGRVEANTVKPHAQEPWGATTTTDGAFFREHCSAASDTPAHPLARP